MPETEPPRTDVARQDLFLDVGLLVLAVALLCGPRLLTKTLWSPDEARYAEVAREMHASGDYLVPRVYGEPETSYPPLYYWLVALCSLPAGRVTATGATMPSFAAALGVALLTYAIGRVLWDRRSARLSALILISTAGFVGPAILCRADMTMAFFELAALFFFIRWYRNRESAKFPLAFYAFVAAATLAKGPQALLVVGGIVLAFLAVRRELVLLRRLRLVPGAAIVLALTLPWYLWAWEATGRDYLLGESLSGFVGTMVQGGHSRRSILNYLAVIPIRAFPWILFLPSALYALRREQSANRTDGTLAFLISWMIVVFVFYSLAAAKRYYYVTAIYPAVALALGRLCFLPSSRFGWKAPLALLACIALGVELTLVLDPDRFGRFASSSARLGAHGLSIFAVVAASLGAFVSSREMPGPRIAAILGGLVVVAHVGAMGFFELPQVRRDDAEGRRFVETLRSALRPEDRIYLFQEDVPSVPLYLDRDCRVLSTAESLGAKMASSEPFVVGVKEWRLPDAQKILGPHRIVFRESIPAGGAVLIFLKPGP
jgi:4-amino-4-deoxy-L-arabinose transferase-like glycosyltransferase